MFRPAPTASAALAALIVMAGASVNAFRYVAATEGWFQYEATLMDQGDFPYRDFYHHVLRCSCC